MLRAFIAVELTRAVRSALATLQAQVGAELTRELRQTAPDARLQWVKPESIHLTVKFLGDIREDQIREIHDALSHALLMERAFRLEVGGWGVFPDLRSPRILWIGVDRVPIRAPSPIVHLAKVVEEAMTTVGFLPESKTFAPHLTLARIKDRGREIGKALSTMGLLSKTDTIGTLPVAEVSLMKSDPQKSGAVYARLCHIALTPTD